VAFLLTVLFYCSFTLNDTNTDGMGTVDNGSDIKAYFESNIYFKRSRRLVGL